MKNVFNKLLQYITYFRRGYSMYITFLVGILNFIVIQYRLLIEQVHFLKYVFSNMLVFALVSLLALFLIAVTLGYFDYKKGTAQIEARLMFEIQENLRRQHQRPDPLQLTFMLTVLDILTKLIDSSKLSKEDVEKIEKLRKMILTRLEQAKAGITYQQLASQNS